MARRDKVMLRRTALASSGRVGRPRERLGLGAVMPLSTLPKNLCRRTTQQGHLFA